ncbi:MAG: RNA-binding protein [Kangiellaceae bacterium]|nr:RNA-binding protein [Kangiellaceae bacterium]MCW9000347.1 RNA-binding protein [Kangiellaceae bacterium]
MKKLFIGNLPSSANESSIIELFAPFGTVRTIKLATDIFSGQCKGFGFVEMEGHEARAAIAGLNGREFEGKNIKINFEKPKGKRRGR